MDIDPEKNPFDTGTENPGYNETGEMNEMDRFPPTSSRCGSEDITNPYRHRTHEVVRIDTIYPGFPFPPKNQGKNSRICPNFNVFKLRLVFRWIFTSPHRIKEKKISDFSSIYHKR